MGIARGGGFQVGVATRDISTSMTHGHVPDLQCSTVHNTRVESVTQHYFLCNITLFSCLLISALGRLEIQITCMSFQLVVAMYSHISTPQVLT